MDIDQIAVIAAGALLAGFLLWFFFGPKRARTAEIRAGVQEIEITVKGGYSPDVIRVREGVPLRLVFDRQEAGDCTSRVVFSDFGVSKSLPAYGKATLEFTPDRAGEFTFTCGMNMVHGTIVVESAEQLATAEQSEALDQAAVERSANGDHAFADAVGVGPEQSRTIETQRAEFRIAGDGVSCATCVVNIESIVDRLPGVDRVDANFASERATVDFDPNVTSTDEIQEAVADGGYRLVLRDQPGSTSTETDESEARRAEMKDLSRRVLVGTVLSLPVVVAVMAADLFSAAWVPEVLLNRWVQLVLTTPVMFWAGWPIHRTGWLALRHRTADMNSLITIGTSAAFGYSLLVTIAPTLVPADVRQVYYEAVGVIITLILLGRLL